VEFFKNVISAAGATCQLLIYMDMWKKPETLYSAYHDQQGVTERFIKHGMQNALSCIVYAPDEQNVGSWTYEVDINKLLKRVEMYINFTKGLSLQKHQLEIRAGERILVEFSTKYTSETIKYIATKCCCQLLGCWGNSSYYTCQLLVPGAHALAQCWTDTDKLFQGISNWNSKPIDLRHPHLFYYGHLCAFTKLKIVGENEAYELDDVFSGALTLMSWILHTAIATRLCHPSGLQKKH